MKRHSSAMLLITFCCIIYLTGSQLGYASDGDVLEQPRIALMEFYNSQTITHVGYVIALGVALATLFSRWSDIWTFFTINCKRLVLLFAIMSLILSLVIYFSMRIVLYSFFSYHVLTITDISEAQGETEIAKMHTAVTEKYQNLNVSLTFNTLLFLSSRCFYHIGFELSMLLLWVILFFLMFLSYKAMKWAELKLRDLFCRRGANPSQTRYFGKH